MKPETLAKIEKQRGKKKNAVWHAGEHIKEFLEDHPQYEDIIAADLDNPEQSLTKFEAVIGSAARANGGGIGGKAADKILREFFGLPATDDAAPPKAAEAAPAGFGFGGGLFG